MSPVRERFAITTGSVELDHALNPRNVSEFGNFSIAEVNIYD